MNVLQQANEFAAIARRAKDLANAHTTYDPVGRLVGMVLGFGPDGGADTSELQEVAVPDDWLAAVTALPSISRGGLELLADSMQSKGWVSVATAIKFVEGEEALAKARV